MSEGVRKNLRTQGKYDDVKVQKNRDKKQKGNISAKDASETRYPKRNSGGSKGINSSFSDEGTSSLTYDENSDYTFRELEEVTKPEEIKGQGKMILSKTVNGESMMFFESHFLRDDEGDEYYDRINDVVPFDSRNIVIHGVEYPQPRLVAWYGPFEYKYSGTTLEPAEMPDVVLEIKEKVERLLKSKNMEASFNSVLINLYRDGKDSVAWHSDDELMLGISPTIASVSLGETRKFELRRKIRNYDGRSPSDHPCKYFVHLTHGSLIVMTGCMQEDWQHRVPKEYHDREPRINLTFRTVYPLEKVAAFFPAKRINPETRKLQPCEYNSSSKFSNSKYKLDDENFPSLQKVIASTKSNITGVMNDKPKSNFRKDDADEKSWDSEISDIEQNVDNGVTHKNSYPVFDKKVEDDKPRNSESFGKEKISKKWHSIEPYCGNEKNPLDDKTAMKRLWYEDFDSSASGFEENNTVKERYSSNYSKSVPNPSANESERNKLYKKIDLRNVYDKDASDKAFQQNITSQEECSVKSVIKANSHMNSTEENIIENYELPNICCAVESNTRVGFSEECNLDMKKTTKMPLNVDAQAFSNSCITQENNDLDNKKLSNTCQYIENCSLIMPSGENISGMKQSKKVILNADAKEFIPSNIKSNEISEYSELNLEDLISYDVNSLQGKDLQDHVKYLKLRITEKIRYDRKDIGFLMEISDGSQTDKNQRLITKEMYRFVQNKLLPTYTSPPFDRNPRPRSYESQNYVSDKEKRFPNQNRNSRSNRNRF